MTRGFITLATGNNVYYKMAANMLASFKLHNPNTSFAIICDQENQYTSKFDDVILLKEAHKDYRDKFSLLVNSPYDETIFIEPDCLIYRNLDYFWDLLSKESDFSSFGWNEGGLDCWFKTKEAKNRLFELLPELPANATVPLFNPGYIFIRKGEKCKKMYDDCLDVACRISNDPLLSNYPTLFCGDKLRDDPVFNIAMAINGFICNAKPSEPKCIALPSTAKLNKINLLDGKLDTTDKHGTQFQNCALLHFSTRRALEEGLYLWQTILLRLCYKSKLLFHLLNNKVFYAMCSAFRFIKTKFKHLFK